MDGLGQWHLALMPSHPTGPCREVARRFIVHPAQPGIAA